MYKSWKESCLKRKPLCLLPGTKTGEKSGPKSRKWMTYWQISWKRHHGVKRFNIRGSKISLWKNQGPLEDHRQEVKSLGGGTQTRIADKKTATTSENTKTEHQEMFGRKWKCIATRTKLKLEETNQKIKAKEGRLTRYHDNCKQYKPNRTIWNNEKNSINI